LLFAHIHLKGCFVFLVETTYFVWEKKRITHLEDEWDEDLTILGELFLLESLLVPLVVSESTRTEVGASPDEEGHGSRSKATGDIVTKPFEALTAIVGRPQETVHTDRRRNLILSSILRILTKRTKNSITVDVADEAKDPHAETNSKTDSVEGG